MIEHAKNTSIGRKTRGLDPKTCTGRREKEETRASVLNGKQPCVFKSHLKYIIVNRCMNFTKLRANQTIISTHSSRKRMYPGTRCTYCTSGGLIQQCENGHSVSVGKQINAGCAAVCVCVCPKVFIDPSISDESDLQPCSRKYRLTVTRVKWNADALVFVVRGSV